MQTAVNDLITFHQTYGAPVILSPSIPPKERQELRKDLVNSEASEEFGDAWLLCQIAQQRLTNAQTALRMLTTTSNTERAQLQKLVDEWSAKSDEALAELADAIADSIYVLIGTALEYGIPLVAVWNEVQRSNMAKLWTQKEVDNSDGLGMNLLECNWSCNPVLSAPPEGRCFVVKNHLGKVMKPPGWSPPNIISIIRNARTLSSESHNEEIRAQISPDTQKAEDYDN